MYLSYLEVGMCACVRFLCGGWCVGVCPTERAACARVWVSWVEGGVWVCVLPRVWHVRVCVCFLGGGWRVRMCPADRVACARVCVFPVWKVVCAYVSCR